MKCTKSDLSVYQHQAGPGANVLRETGTKACFKRADPATANPQKEEVKPVIEPQVQK